MDETLRHFVERRIQELIDAERPLREKLEEIARERRELERTAKAIGLGSIINTRSESAEGQRKTIKEAVIEILNSKPHGLTAMDILKELNSMTDTKYPRTSLSPQLSRLKRDGRITQSGIVWSLAKSKA
jgi:hypothetical protein